MKTKLEMISEIRKTNPFRSVTSWMQEPHKNIKEIYDETRRLRRLTERRIKNIR